MKHKIHKIENHHREWIKEFTKEHWGSKKIVSIGRIFLPHELEGFIAVKNDEKIGLVTYDVKDDICEIVSINSLAEKQGVGTALVEEIIKTAKDSGCKKIMLTTTNDNLNALSFWQKRGFKLVKIHRDSIKEARKLKPEIPEIGEHGI